MANDYRALHNQYAQGMSQPGTVQPNSVPGFNFLQGWAASPTAGYLPPKSPAQAPIQYGDPTQGGWIGGPDGQPIGGGMGSQWGVNGDPRAMLHDGIKNNFRDWQNAYGGGNQQGGALSQLMPQGRMQANYGMQQPSGGYGGKDPYPVYPIAMPKPNPNFGIPMPKPQPNFGTPMPKPIVQYDQYGKPIRNDQPNPGRPIIPDYNWGP